MKKFLFLIFAVIFLAGCGVKSPTDSIIDAGIERVERAETTIKDTETLAQCKAVAQDALLSAKVDMLNARESCMRERASLESDLIRWKSYFALLILCVGVAIYLFIVRKMKDVI